VVWIAGWAATGFVYQTAWLAILILTVTGPVLWIIVWAWHARLTPGRREPVRRRAITRQAITGPAAPGGAADR
jgi:hypothetical protein